MHCGASGRLSSPALPGFVHAGIAYSACRLGVEPSARSGWRRESLHMTGCAAGHPARALVSWTPTGDVSCSGQKAVCQTGSLDKQQQVPKTIRRTSSCGGRHRCPPHLIVLGRLHQFTRLPDSTPGTSWPTLLVILISSTVSSFKLLTHTPGVCLCVCVECVKVVYHHLRSSQSVIPLCAPPDLPISSSSGDHTAVTTS